MHNDGDDEAAKAIIPIAIAVIGGGGFFLHQATGASFTSIFNAMPWIAAAFALAVVVGYLMGGAYLLPLVVGTLAVVWLICWPVLDSAACGGCNPADRGYGFMPWEAVWWDGWWFKWGVEAALVTGCMGLFIRSVSEPHGYY